MAGGLHDQAAEGDLGAEAFIDRCEHGLTAHGDEGREDPAHKATTFLSSCPAMGVSINKKHNGHPSTPSWPRQDHEQMPDCASTNVPRTTLPGNHLWAEATLTMDGHAPLEAMRTVLSEAVSGPKAKCLTLVGVYRAHMSAPVLEPMYVEIVDDAKPEANGGKCWKLLRSTYGARLAALAWQREPTRRLTHLVPPLGKPHHALLFISKRRDACVFVHGGMTFHAADANRPRVDLKWAGHALED